MDLGRIQSNEPEDMKVNDAQGFSSAGLRKKDYMSQEKKK